MSWSRQKYICKEVVGQNGLADCYANGDGVRKNARQAALWHAKASDK